MIQLISAVNFVVRDMARSIEFYKKVGFESLYGDERATFTSLKAGEVVVNLSANPGYEHGRWGRIIFRVDDVDAHYRSLQARINVRTAERRFMGRVVLSCHRSRRTRT